MEWKTCFLRMRAVVAPGAFTRKEKEGKEAKTNETGSTVTKTASNMVFSSDIVSLLKYFSISIQNAELKSRALRGPTR